MTSTKDANGPGKVAQQYDQVGFEPARPLIVEFSAHPDARGAHRVQQEKVTETAAWLYGMHFFIII